VQQDENFLSETIFFFFNPPLNESNAAGREDYVRTMVLQLKCYVFSATLHKVLTREHAAVLAGVSCFRIVKLSLML